MNVWDKLAGKYERLWVQKYSLGPTRDKVAAILAARGFRSLLDLGCGTGQTLEKISETFPEAELFGADKSEGMISAARAKNIRAEFIEFDIDERKLAAIFPNKSFDAIICCHAFPYFGNQFEALRQVRDALADDGAAIFVHASVNSLYDELIMEIVETTAEPAEYLSRSEFRFATSLFFEVTQEFQIKERFYMPTISGFVLEKRR